MKITVITALMAGLVVLPAQAEVSAKQAQAMKQMLASYAKQAESDGRKAAEPVFSAEAGRSFYIAPRPWQQHDRTCSTCHTADPTKEGVHSQTKKPIKPLAPTANPERFVDAAKVEKNFAEHCLDLYERDCRAVEKGHFVAYMRSLK